MREFVPESPPSSLPTKSSVGELELSKLRIGIAIIVTAIWATGYTIAFFDRTFEPRPEASGIMLAVVTWLFGSEIKKRIESEKDK